jgi:hypothetical protein
MPWEPIPGSLRADALLLRESVEAAQAAVEASAALRTVLTLVVAVERLRARLRA